MDSCRFRSFSSFKSPLVKIMKEIIVQFICRIKEDLYKLMTDITVYWLWFLSVMELSESWLLFHGGAILVLGRLILLGMDFYKRTRDLKEPEWKSNISPILKKEAIEDRKKGFLQKIIDTFKELLKW